MCGICGIYSMSMTEKEIEVFKRLLLINQLRGEDSTGVLRITTDRHVNTLKGLGDSGKYLRNPATKDFLDVKHKPLLLMGHCRAATIGSITKENAHPFTFQNVAGVMNGTFRGDFDNSKDFHTDTEAIYFNINKSIEENDGDPIPGLQSSFTHDSNFALSFVNRKKGTLNFIRGGNGQMRPLHFTYLSGRTTLVWSSTAEMLEFIVNDIMELKASGWKVGDKDTTWSINKYDHYEIPIGKPATSGKLSHTTLEDKKWLISSSNVYTTNPQSQYYLGYEDYVDGDNDDGPAATGASSKYLIKCKDGQYRTQEAEDKRLGKSFRPPNSGSGKHSNVSGPSVDEIKKSVLAARGNFRSTGTGKDLSTLGWLKDAVESELDETQRRAAQDEKFEIIALAKTGSRSDMNRPQSVFELKYRLNEGCMCCGNKVDPDDLEEVKRVRWWSREAFACGDCYDFSDGDWVRCSIEDDWTEQGKHQLPKPVGVQVH